VASKWESREKVSPVTLVLIGLILVFYNNIVGFLASYGFASAQANAVILMSVIVLAYYKTPWIKAILRG